MSKQCLNCGRDISGVGNNKIFCDDCFYLIASFLQEIRRDKAPALTVYRRNRVKFDEAGISAEAQRYIERCCRRFDEKKAAEAAAAAAAASQPSLHNDGAGQAAPSEVRGGDSAVPLRPVATSQTRAPQSQHTAAPGRGPGELGAGEAKPHMPEQAERSDVPPVPMSGAGAAPSLSRGRNSGNGGDSLDPALSKLTLDFTGDAKTDNNTDNSTDENESTSIFIPISLDADAPVAPDPASFSAAKSAVYGIDLSAEDVGGGHGFVSDGNDAGDSGDGGGNGGDGNDNIYGAYGDGGEGVADNDDAEVRRRLFLICGAAAVAVILFLTLFIHGTLGAPKPPIGDDTTTKAPVYIHPSDTTTAPGDDETTEPPATDSGTEPTDTDPVTDPPEHEHIWNPATCSEPLICTICGATDGNPLGHDFGDASCDEPATCIRCGETGAAGTGHTWGAPVFTWMDNNTSAVAVFTCTRDRSHTETVNAVITSTETAPTCDVTGGITYTATAMINNIPFTDTREGTAVPALGHAWDAAPTFTWSDDGTSATATFVCSRDNTHTETVTATMKTSGTPATCTAAGSATYTATVTRGGKTYNDSKTVSSAALGHAWGTPTFKWNANHTSCTATFTCTHDSSHTENVNATVSGPDHTKAATCTDAGTDTYTATAQHNGQSYTDRATVEIPALGHEFGADGYTCSRCGQTPAPVAAMGSSQNDPHTELSIKFVSLHSEVNGNNVTSTLVYEITNTSSNQSYDAGSFKMYLSSGKLVSANDVDCYNATRDEPWDASTPIFPGDVIRFNATFRMSRTDADSVLFLEYRSKDYSGYGSGSQMFSKNPKAALYWKLD